MAINEEPPGPATPGYSGRTMSQKLGVKSGMTLVLHAAPADWRIPELPDGVEIRSELDGGFAIAICFIRSLVELAAGVEHLADQVPAGSSVWFAWPRKAGGHVSDVTEQAIRDHVLPTGLVDVKVAALDADWSGLKFLWRRTKRPA